MLAKIPKSKLPYQFLKLRMLNNPLRRQEIECLFLHLLEVISGKDNTFWTRVVLRAVERLCSFFPRFYKLASAFLNEIWKNKKCTLNFRFFNISKRCNLFKKKLIFILSKKLFSKRLFRVFFFFFCMLTSAHPPSHTNYEKRNTHLTRVPLSL